jgi:hypothetical protein
MFLTVLGPEQDHVAAVRGGEVARPQVGDVGELVAELGREAGDERDVARRPPESKASTAPGSGRADQRSPSRRHAGRSPFELKLEPARPTVHDDLRTDRR